MAECLYIVLVALVGKTKIFKTFRSSGESCGFLVFLLVFTSKLQRRRNLSQES